MWYTLLYNCWVKISSLCLSSFPHTNTHHIHHTYCIYLKSLKLSTHQCFSLEFHFRNANALGPDTQWFISLFIFAHICLCPCVCLLLIPPFFQPACLPWDLRLPLLPLSATYAHGLCACIYTKHMRVQMEGENIQLRSLSRCFTLTLLLSALLGPNNPVCSRPCTEVSALRASTICTLSLLSSEHCGGALLEAIESDLIPTLAFCQQRLHSEKRNGSSRQTNLLLYVSCGQIEYEQNGLELCFSCQKQVWITAGPATTPPSEVSYLHSNAIK